MRLIIEIPEEMYELIKDGYVPWEINKYLKNSIPLPKGHGRLIDADVVYDDFEEGEYDFEESLEFAPTIIPADKESEDKA